MSNAEKIIQGIDDALAEPYSLEGLSADEVATIALEGLKASVDLGYMLEENARSMYGNHFPTFDYDTTIG